jgi:hypothetical protein
MHESRLRRTARAHGAPAVSPPLRIPCKIQAGIALGDWSHPLEGMSSPLSVPSAVSLQIRATGCLGPIWRAL